MIARMIRNVVSALFVVAFVGASVFALQASNPLADSPADFQPGADQPEVTTQQQDDGRGACHGLQRAYWAVTSNPGRGEGKEAAAAALVEEATSRDCELSDAPPGSFPGGRPDWAGGPPPWAGTDDADDGSGPPWATEGDGPPWGPPPWAGKGDDAGTKGKGRGGPPWATEGDGPPFGLAWGHWLSHAPDDVCAKIAARLEAHPGAAVPEDLRARITDELGCSLP